MLALREQRIRRRPWTWFLVWFLLGAGYGLGVVGLLSIGVLLLPVCGAITVLVLLRWPGRGGLAGLICGPSAPLGYVAYLNRHGPGTVCSTTEHAQSCVEQTDPRMWAIAAACFLIVGLAVEYAVLRRCHTAGDDAPEDGTG
ncbi:hypothetical protein [Actinomadura rupiterrae]|uniref:hypothetical protein n=1 Tax=Actinomadura rupiterrae TaxID=559627 RepID=UPI0020A5BFC7|nr:hypothetical protein [Actinomadura rupiterrae]MCP2343843.1 preprotein translocase subunit SecG [Actinomadura rupiterrae]